MKLFKSNSKIASQQVNNIIVQEIHESFNTEVETLLVEAKNLRKSKAVDEHLLSKAEKLENLGFRNAKEVKEASTEISEQNKILVINAKKENLAEAIEYFSVKYPQYKFITEESIIKICNKYGLVYGDVFRYIGTVPDNKVEAMSNFKLLDEDYSYTIRYLPPSYIMTSSQDQTVSLAQGTELLEASNQRRKEEHKLNFPYQGERHDNLRKKNFIIAAPLKDFDTDRMELKNFKLTNKAIPVPDPVVMQAITYKDTEYYLIVTAWGDEASDEYVVNQKMN